MNRVQRGFHNELPIRYKLMITIWWLGNQETYRQVADRFGTTRGDLYYDFHLRFSSNSLPYSYISLLLYLYNFSL